MKKTLPVLFFCALLCPAVQGQNWSFGAGTGPFVFGDFVERTVRIGNGEGSADQTTKLSAATRAGLSVDLERRLGSRFALRFEGTFTRAPLVVKSRSGSGVELDAGKINVGTALAPLVFRINSGGTFRFHLMGGPAYAAYNIKGREGLSSALRPFVGTRSRWGGALGGGIDWKLSDRFALEGQITDIATASPFKRSDFSAGLGRITIPKPHNVHTTVGIRYGF